MAICKLELNQVVQRKKEYVTTRDQRKIGTIGIVEAIAPRAMLPEERDPAHIATEECWPIRVGLHAYAQNAWGCACAWGPLNEDDYKRIREKHGINDKVDRAMREFKFGPVRTEIGRWK